MTETFAGEARVLENIEAWPGFRRMRLSAPAIAHRAVPGQFVMVGVGPSDQAGWDPLLKRPLSLHRIGPDGEIALLYRVVGTGTGRLARLVPGDRVDILGPLGRGFDPGGLETGQGADPRPRVILAAGGVGLAPFLALAEKWAGRADMVLLYGARTASEVPPEGHFRQYFARVRVTTDDGTKGRKGFVTDLLMDELSQGSGLILACGPRPMLAETARLALAAGAPCQVSLEARMACGLGACLGCVVPAAGSDRAYLRVCAEGPVFSAGEVSWPEWT